MKFIASVALLASVTAAAVMPRQDTRSFNGLMTYGSPDTAKNNLYLYIVKPAATWSMGAFSPNRSDATAGLIEDGYLLFPMEGEHGITFSANVVTDAATRMFAFLFNIRGRWLTIFLLYTYSWTGRQLHYP